MGLNTFGATGVALPPPQALYPVTILGAPQVVATNRISLPPGGDVLIPPGTWYISNGIYSMIQVLDPVSNTWSTVSSQMQNDANPSVSSDGVNFRLVNPTGFPVGVIVNNGGTGYTSAPAVAIGSGSGATFLAIVGGAVSAININSAGSGANYAIPPIVNIAAPPTPGVPATAVCAISGGLITGFTIVNPGAGYTSAPAVTIVPQQSDLNVAGGTLNVTNAKATAQLSYVGVVTAVLLTNEGNAVQGQNPALTFSGGAGSGVTATAVMALTITNIQTTTPGSGYATPVAFQTFCGTITSSAAASNSPVISTTILDPRNVIFPGSIG